MIDLFFVKSISNILRYKIFIPENLQLKIIEYKNESPPYFRLRCAKVFIYGEDSKIV